MPDPLPSAVGAPRSRKSRVNEAVLLLLTVLGSVGVGVAIGFSALFTLGALSALTLGLLYFKRAPKVETVVALYWAVFAVMSTVVSTISIGGFYYPFYLALLAFVLLKLFTDGVRFDNALIWLIAAFLFIVLVSLLNYPDPVDSTVTQKIVAMLVCPAIVLAVGPRCNTVALTSGAVIGSAVIAAWVWISAAEGGFRYRGDITANENSVAFTLGLGLMVTVAFALNAFGRRKRGPVAVLLIVLAGVMAYALLLLASRGMTIALLVALAGLGLQVIAFHREKVWVLVLVVLLGASSLLLPGGDGIIERFKGESIESAGDRTPLWQAVLETYADGSLLQLVLGNGFNGSTHVVRRAVGTLTSTHNAYLAVLFDYGALGLLAFLAIHVYGLVRAFQRSYTALVASGLLWFILGGAVSATVHDDFMYWIGLGVALVLAMERPRCAPGAREVTQPARLLACAESSGGLSIPRWQESSGVSSKPSSGSDHADQTQSGSGGLRTGW